MKNNRGETYIMTCAFLIIFCMLLSVFIQFFSVVNVIRMTEKNARIVLDSFVMENSIEIYDSIKNGTNYLEVIDQDEYINKLCEYNCLDFQENMLYCKGEDGTENYKMTKPILQPTEENKLKISATYTITVPMYFCGERVTEVTVPITVTSKFNPKFN